MAKVKPTPESYMHFTMVDKWGRLVGVPGDRMEAFLRQQETQTERPQGLELTAEQMDRIREAAAASGLEMTPRQQEPESPESTPED